jgi:hypothetical protein
MTGRSYEKMIYAEAKRFPKVAELLARAAELTDEEIATADVPLPWYRMALTRIRNEERGKAKMGEMKSEMESGSSYFRHGSAPPIKGYQAVYCGPDQYVMMLVTEMLLRSGTLVFFPLHGGMWIESSAGPHAPVSKIVGQCRDNVETTLDAYKAAYNARMVSLHPDAPLLNDPGQSTGGAPMTPMMGLASMGVRFS